jgi:hypothetical protein
VFKECIRYCHTSIAFKKAHGNVWQDNSAPRRDRVASIQAYPVTGVARSRQLMENSDRSQKTSSRFPELRGQTTPPKQSDRGMRDLCPTGAKAAILLASRKRMFHPTFSRFAPCRRVLCEHPFPSAPQAGQAMPGRLQRNGLSAPVSPKEQDGRGQVLLCMRVLLRNSRKSAIIKPTLYD